MSDMLDSEAGEELAEEEALKISRIDSTHELIRLFMFVGGSKAEWEKLRDEFTTRFGKEGFRGKDCKGEMALGYFWGKYYLALKEERLRLEMRAKVA